MLCEQPPASALLSVHQDEQGPIGFSRLYGVLLVFDSLTFVILFLYGGSS